jgi:hypothetical protein
MRGEIGPKYVLVRKLVLNAATCHEMKAWSFRIGGIFHKPLTPHKPQPNMALARLPPMSILCV